MVEGRVSPLPCHHPYSLRSHTHRCCQRRVEGWSGQGCWYYAGPRCRQHRHRPRTYKAPLTTVNNKVYWWKTGNEDSYARNHLYASRSREACPAVVSRARYPLNRTMWAGRSARDDSFFFRGRRKRSTSAPVTVPWRRVIAVMISRGVRLRVSVTGGVRNSKAI